MMLALVALGICCFLAGLALGIPASPVIFAKLLKHPIILIRRLVREEQRDAQAFFCGYTRMSLDQIRAALESHGYVINELTQFWAKGQVLSGHLYIEHRNGIPHKQRHVTIIATDQPGKYEVRSHLEWSYVSHPLKHTLRKDAVKDREFISRILKLELE